MRGEEKRDAAFRFQCGEWIEQQRFDQVIRWIFRGRRQLLRRRMRLPLSHHYAAQGSLLRCGN